jgi:hypothetical protein
MSFEWLDLKWPRSGAVPCTCRKPARAAIAEILTDGNRPSSPAAPVARLNIATPRASRPLPRIGGLATLAAAGGGFGDAVYG